MSLVLVAAIHVATSSRISVSSSRMGCILTRAGKRGASCGSRVGRRIAQGSLIPRDVVPAAEFAPDRPEDADRLEADADMQSDARLVRQCNAGVRVAEPLACKIFEKLHVQRASDALPVLARMHVRGHFDRPAIRSAFAQQRAICISDALTIFFSGEPLPLRQSFLDARGEFRSRGYGGFE